jgi:hypothetical protein
MITLRTRNFPSILKLPQELRSLDISYLTFSGRDSGQRWLYYKSASSDS